MDANTYWLAGDSGTVLKTTDGGASWKDQSGSATNDIGAKSVTNIAAIAVIGQEIAWMAGQGGLIMKTLTGGGG